MKNLVVFFALAIFACVFITGISAAADISKAGAKQDVKKQKPYTEYPGEIGDIARQAEAEVKDINQAYEQEKENLDTVKHEQYFEDYKEEKAGSLLSQNDIASLEAKRAKEEKAIRTKTAYEINDLVAEQAAQQKAPAAGAGFRAPRTSKGTVQGIVFCENKGAALINSEVVKQDDVIMGVKVVKIAPDFVEFDKQGKQWKQQVGETPSAEVWESAQPQKPEPAPRPLTDTKPKKKSGK